MYTRNLLRSITSYNKLFLQCKNSKYNFSKKNKFNNDYIYENTIQIIEGDIYKNETINKIEDMYINESTIQIIEGDIYKNN